MEEKKVLNETNNRPIYKGPMISPLSEQIAFYDASSQCKRAVGAGYYDSKSNKTNICYSGPGMDVHIGEFNHSSETSTMTKVFENKMYNRWDYHNYANMVRLPNGEKAVFFVEHTRRMYMIQSPTWEKRLISEDYTCYPSPVVVGEEIYVFYSRHENKVNGNVVDGVKMRPYRSLCYIKSSDLGLTWHGPVRVVDTENISQKEMDEVYLCSSEFFPAIEGMPDRILLGWTMWGGVNGHASSNQSAYLAYLSLEDNKCYNGSGNLVGDFVACAEMESKCLVYEDKTYDDKAFSIASVLTSVLNNGNALCVYGVLDDNQGSSIRSAECIDNMWHEIMIDTDTYSVKDIYKCPKSGSIKIVYAKGDCLIISQYNDESQKWVTASTTKIEFYNGANSVQYANFIDNHKEVLSVVIGLMDNEALDNLYQGIWPVYGYGTKII